MKKNLNKLATLALTGILMTGMSFGALADEDGATPVMSFDKVVTTDATNFTYAPNTTFEFEVKGAGAETTNVKNWNGSATGEVYAEAGRDGDVTVGSAAFAPTDAKDETRSTDAVTVYSKKVTLTPDMSRFTKAGVYHYTLKETEGTYDGVDYDKTPYDLYAVILNDGTDREGKAKFKCDGIVLAKNGEKVTEITNDYGKTEDTTHDIRISKTVTGTLGNLTDGFEFTVTVKGEEGEQYRVIGTDGTTASVLTSGTAGTFTIAHGQNIHIYGLTEKDTVTVTEKKADQDGYTTSVKYYEGNEDSGTDKKGKSLNVAVDGAELKVVNERNSTTPTGVVMDIAPYAAMILGAGAFAGVFLGKKKSEDEE